MVIGPPGTGKSFTIAALTSDLISKGKSVLIASKRNQAGKVIADMIEHDFGLKGLVIKTARKSYKRSLTTRLNNILFGITSSHADAHDLKIKKKRILSLKNRLDKLTDQLINKEKYELEWGAFFQKHNKNIFNYLKSKWIEYRHNSSDPIWRIKAKIDKLESQRRRQTKRFICQQYHYFLDAHLEERRKDVLHLIEALNKDAGNLIQQAFDQVDFDIILKALPAWICNTSEIHHILPLKADLFDVLIIDEATQCDVSSCLPLIYRAKKIVVVGDPKQLRHISFLSMLQQRIFKTKYKITEDFINYRENSILDFINQSITNQDQIVFLNEHYRSHPDIIKYSNEHFYNGQLNIMTANPRTVHHQHLYIKNVKGTRNTKGQNLVEAHEILASIARIIEKEQLLKTNLVSSIGVISPFQAQATLLKSLIRTNISLNDIKKHKILIGTPYHFQGEERDIVHISFVVDGTTHHSSYNYLNRSDVFNVCITRAKRYQWVYTSILSQELKKESLLSTYLTSRNDGINMMPTIDKSEDKFSKEVIEEINKGKVDQVLLSQVIAGVEVDLVVIKDQKTYCIDLIGYPGVYEMQFTISNLQLLGRMQYPVFFLPYSTWYLNNNTSVKNQT